VLKIEHADASAIRMGPGDVTYSAPFNTIYGESRPCTENFLHYPTVVFMRNLFLLLTHTSGEIYYNQDILRHIKQVFKNAHLDKTSNLSFEDEPGKGRE